MEACLVGQDQTTHTHTRRACKAYQEDFVDRHTPTRAAITSAMDHRAAPSRMVDYAPSVQNAMHSDKGVSAAATHRRSTSSQRHASMRRTGTSPATPNTTVTPTTSNSVPNATEAAELTAAGIMLGPGVRMEEERERHVRKDQVCVKCSEVITGQFVRALSGVYHLDCFTCADCGRNVASKFFSATEEMVKAAGGEQFPLCETDYFRRLDLLCAKCGRALRGSYITALGSKYHVDHFTCSLCSTPFGPEDSYYEHEGQVYCHFHYSTLFAIQCTGCQTAILKQFVEINRNNADEHWHPECYMIHRYWKIKLAPAGPAPTDTLPDEVPLSMPGGLTLTPSSSEEQLVQTRRTHEETPTSVLQKQRAMEIRVFTIWRVLSSFEESSAGCISDMLRHVSNGKYVGGVRFAARFVLHVEVLFSAIDELEVYFQKAHASTIQYVREARMLCKKIVNFFSLLSHTQEMGVQRMHITQELLSLVTGLAHYLKILIRISLTGALRLDQEHGVPTALESFLARLDELVTLQGGDTDTVHGYTSLPQVCIPTYDTESASDLCVTCGKTVEDECLRVGITMRWHWSCIRCTNCQRVVVKPDGTIPVRQDNEDIEPTPAPGAITYFVVHSMGRHDRPSTFCTTCMPSDANGHFLPVTRLEQYAFLLCVALNRLDALLKRRARLQVPSSGNTSSSDEPDVGELTDAESSTYRKSPETKRLESQYLNRHMSNKARVPRISTVVNEPTVTDDSGASAAAAEVAGTATTVLASADPSPLTRERAIVPSHEEVVVRERDRIRERSRERERTPIPSRADIDLTNDEGITLADIPMILQAEQDREQREQLGVHVRRPISSLSAEEMQVSKCVAILRLQKSALAELVDTDELLDLVETRKNTFWGKILFRGSSRRSDVRKKGVFGVSLDYLVERHGADSVLGATPTPMRVPAFVDDVVSAMRQMDVSVEGIFRKNGSVRRLKELSDALDREVEAINMLDDHPVQLAALLKKFLRELPEPLLTSRLYRLFLQTQTIDSAKERHRLVGLIAMLLPRAHRDTLEVLFVFLRWVATFAYVDDEAGSRMDLHNLATVMAPSLLYSRNSEPSHGEAILAQAVVCHMLEYQDDLWFVQHDMDAALRDRSLIAVVPELTPHELLKRCALYA